jgi:PAS domain S-box-containing protein
VVGLSAADLCEDPHRWQELAEALADRGVVVDFEARLLRRDGSAFWGQLNVRAIEGSGGVLYQDGTIADIDRRIELEEALKRGKEEWERTFDAVRELILISDEQSRTVRVNRTAAEALGVRVADMIGRHCHELIHGTQAPPDSCPMCRFSESREQGEFPVRRDDLGAEFHFSLTPRFDEEGELAGIIHVGRDVTDQRRLDEVLRRQEMVVQAEQIFRTFRHEVGNALNTLKTTLTVLRSNYEVFSPEQREIYFSRCLESFRLAEQLLRALRSYQSLDRVHPAAVEVRQLLEEKEGLLFAAARDRGVTCTVSCCEGPLWIDADPDALVRILLNLVENAIEATANREDPTIDLSCHPLRGQAVLRVCDNGAGIHPDDRPHVFAPLFTTRAEGSGLGLAIVQKLMVQMGGITTIDSELDEGCTVELRFPVLSGREGG